LGACAPISIGPGIFSPAQVRYSANPWARNEAGIIDELLRREVFMKPSFEEYRRACPEAEEALLSEHISRLSDHYFSAFSKKDLYRHLAGLARLSPQNPVEVLVDARRDGSVDCTVLAFDHPSEFSIITGTLAGMGFEIISGDVFTYQRTTESPRKVSARRRRPRQRIPQDPVKRRRIIDYFCGLRETSQPFRAWAAALQANMTEIITLLERADLESMDRAKQRVNEMVVKRLAQLQKASAPVLYPVQIDIDRQAPTATRLRIVSQDTPAFLYALSNALSLQEVSIEHVRIRTIRRRIEDQIDLVDSRGHPIEDSRLLDQIKFSVLLTKQFTYFLGRTPDPFTALSRFEHLVKDILRMPSRGEWIDLLANPHTLRDLARLLGTSDFLWEDFIRLQYETLLPMLAPQVEGHRLSEPIETLPDRLTRALKDAASYEEKVEKLNQFKDREIYLIDLDHILSPTIDFRTLAEHLTILAEQVVRAASHFAYELLAEKYGTPRTVAGLEATYAILGMGKLGGAALGYASDIELLFVYSDNGRTDGPTSVDNAEFFGRLVRQTARAIHAKKEGIFEVDLRLRPHGNSGPPACSLENFCRYYGQGGQAHSYERLAMVRLRAVGGDRSLGSQLERLRDEILYESNNISFAELRELRARQFEEKTKGGRLNAKFSPGGLVDLEYGVQVLQVMHGKDLPQLRTPRIHEALRALADAGVFSAEEASALIKAYDFLRQVINSMRMLRGSAKDLFLPPTESDEFIHLARRMGYERGGPLDPAQQLHIDFETHSAMVRIFAERHFGRKNLPGSDVGTIADLVLSEQMSPELRNRILIQGRFRDPVRAYVNLKGLAGKGTRKDAFTKLALLAYDILKRTPDPDRALNNWERLIHSLASPEFHYNVLLSQPMRLEILLNVFATSQFLADTLIRNPGFLDWVMEPDILHQALKRDELEEELRSAGRICFGHPEWLNKLRRFRRRCFLRVGIRDICLGLSLRQTVHELSLLAEACIQVTLEQILEKLAIEGRIPEGLDDVEGQFCVMALGKLGGNELNYSSDIDLVGLCSDGPSDGTGGKDYAERKRFFSLLMENLRADLSTHTEEGYVYRVDLRLRPFGGAGELVSNMSSLVNYYRRSASLWEVQAAIKMRPVAGNLRLGFEFLQRIQPIITERRSRREIVASIERMRNAHLSPRSQGLIPAIDVKSGLGGLRDIEFLVQGLQLLHASEARRRPEGHTIMALEALNEVGLLSAPVVDQLKEDYTFLRRIEHYLQILEDRQTHTLPRDQQELDALAKRMLGVEQDSNAFLAALDACLTRVRDAYTRYLLEKEDEEG
jgi:glutamate-ammonia-ligase adenylyltransferase